MTDTAQGAGHVLLAMVVLLSVAFVAFGGYWIWRVIDAMSAIARPQEKKTDAKG